MIKQLSYARKEGRKEGRKEKEGIFNESIKRIKDEPDIWINEDVDLPKHKILLLAMIQWEGFEACLGFY